MIFVSILNHCFYLWESDRCFWWDFVFRNSTSKTRMFFKKWSRAFKKMNRSFFKNNRMFWCFYHSYCITWQNTLFFFQKFQSLRKRPVHRLFGWRICTIKSFSRKMIFQRDRVSDVVLFGFLSVFGFTFIHLLTTAERKNYAVEGSQCINLSAGMPMNRTFAERLKLLKVFGGFSGEGISFKRWIRISKRT